MIILKLNYIFAFSNLFDLHSKYILDVECDLHKRSCGKITDNLQHTTDNGQRTAKREWISLDF